MQKFKCTVCGYIYDESAGIPPGIKPGTKWASVPDGFLCPLCKAPKSVFVPLTETAPAVKTAVKKTTAAAASPHTEGIGKLSAGGLSAVCSNLAKGCEKQRLDAETAAFYQIADYFKAKAAAEVKKDKTLKDTLQMLNDDTANGLPAANAAAKADGDRGALRSLVWSEKVGIMTKSLTERFIEEGDAMLKDTNLYVCDICGFISFGSAPPEICPVCKVPNFRILQVERR